MTSSGFIQRFLLASSKDITFTEPSLASTFTRIATSKDSGALLYECQHVHTLPPLAIRPARVEDHDDLLPVLELAGRKFPALAKLPETSRPDEPFALTRVVSGQDSRNQVLVAEAGRRLVSSGGRLGGASAGWEGMEHSSGCSGAHGASLAVYY